MEYYILVILLILPGVWSRDWAVTLEDQCALKGADGVLKCSYSFPWPHSVTSVAWLKVQVVNRRRTLVALSDLPSISNRFQFVGNFYDNCYLRINGVDPSDEGEYFFSFETTWDRWKSGKAARLTVKELVTTVEPRTVLEGDNVSLNCESGCGTSETIRLFKDGQYQYELRSASVMQARREDAGSYHCATVGLRKAKSDPVALNVLYAPQNVTLWVSPSADVVLGSSVTLSCSSEANPTVARDGYVLYKDGQILGPGPNHTITDVRLDHSGLYHCSAWNDVSRRRGDPVNSTGIHLDVQYEPMDILLSMDPQDVPEGGSVNLTCSCVANPAAANYTWYRRPVNSSASTSSTRMLQVGSGRTLSLPSVDESHAGLYVCQARNSVGGKNSSEVLLSVIVVEAESQSDPLIVGLAGLAVLAALVTVLLLVWRKKRTYAEEKTALGPKLSDRDSVRDDQLNSIYANIDDFSSSPPLVTTEASPSQRNLRHGHDAPVSDEDDIVYSTVIIRSREANALQHTNSSREPPEPWSRASQREDSVIYATVTKSRPALSES